MMTINSITIGTLCLLVGFAAGHLYPTAHYVHIGATSMYNERTGHICHGLRGGTGIAAEKIDPKAQGGSVLDGLVGGSPVLATVPFCGEEDR